MSKTWKCRGERIEIIISWFTYYNSNYFNDDNEKNRTGKQIISDSCDFYSNCLRNRNISDFRLISILSALGIAFK